MTDLDLNRLHAFQASPVGQVVASVMTLTYVVDALKKLSANRSAWKAIISEQEDIELAHQQLGRLIRQLQLTQQDPREASDA